MKGNFQVRFLEGGGPVTARSHSALVITHKSDALRLARLFGKLAYHPAGGRALT
jgi:hypothetical protein